MNGRIKTASISPTASVRHAMQAIERGRVGVALVCEANGQFRALVTDGDIRRALLKGMGLETSIKNIERTATTVARADIPREKLSALFSDSVQVIPLLDEDERVADLAFKERTASVPISQPMLGERELVYVTECILSGWISTGRFVTEFEKRCAAYCKVPHAISTSNGTVALHLALLALGVGPGDEVIVPTLTFIATANAVTYTGAKPVFVDSEPTSWNIDPDAIEPAITSKTKAVIVVHLYGHPCEMRRISAICRARGIALIEDAAEAFGSTYCGEPVGSWSDIAIFSFYGNKIITTGEGGMIITRRAELDERCRLLRDHGMTPQRRYWHPVLGYNYRMTNLQAAVGVAQIEKIETIIAAKRRIAREYLAEFATIPGLTCAVEPCEATSVFWLISVCVDSEIYGINRDQLMRVLQSEGIETRPVFPVLHRQPIYDQQISLPVAEQISANGLNFPSYPALSTSEIMRITQIIREAPLRILAPA